MSLGNPAALTRSGCPTRAGAAGRRAGRRLGRRRCGPTSRCERRGTCPPPACTSSPWGAQGEGLGRVHRRRAPPWVAQVLGGQEAAWRGRGRVSYLFLFPGERPVGFGYERLQRRDVVVAQINLGQGQHVRGGNGGGAGGSDSRGAAPYLVALVPGHGERHLGLFAGDDVFSAGKEQFPLRWDTNHPQTVPVSQCRAPPPPFSLLHPRIPLAFSAHRSSRIFFLALASLYLLTPS